MDITQALPTVDAVVQLPPEELAGYIMETLLNPKAGLASDLHLGNLLLRIMKQYNNAPQVDGAIREAWASLVREGLLIPKEHDWFSISTRGKELKGRHDLDSFRRATILPKNSLHPALAHVWLTFIVGKYDVAVFEAFKEIEVAVRSAAGYEATDLGTKLMTKAFGSEKSPLADLTLPEAERQAMAFLFSGAIGFFKNPSSHRYVVFSDPTEVAEVLRFASLLRRIIDARMR